MLLNIISDFLSETDINYILNLPEVIEAKTNIDSKINGSVNFSISLTPSIKNNILEKFGLNLDSVPMRWIKGDTHPHIDTGLKQFQKTHLVYLTNSPGEILLGNNSYPIIKGNAFIFDESLKHETINTGLEPRLLLGPMSEEGLAVGATGISGPGGTTVYIRDVGSGIEFRYSYDPDPTNWQPLPIPTCYVQNTNTASGMFIVEFTTDITINLYNQYLYCISNNIQFGSKTLKSDGTRPIIYIDGSPGGFNYDGFIQNYNGSSGYNSIHIFNLEVRSINSSVLYINGGWLCQSYFGAGATDNYIINCYSDGEIAGNSSGGIVGSDAARGGNLNIIGCSSSGKISGNNAGGIVGQQAGYLGGIVTIESCWSSGEISNDSAGGIVGALSGSVEVTNCYSTGSITGNNSGGIIGANSGTEPSGAIIQNCYTTGAIGSGIVSTSNAGGICGSLFGTCTVSITNCYTTGYLSNDFITLNGAICGVLFDTSMNLTINHCYTSGGTNYNTGYIIGGVSVVNGSGTGYTSIGNYSEAANSSSGWNVTNAQSTLTGVPSYPPVTWISIGISLPYELFNMGYTPYSTTNIVANSLVRNSSLSVVAGGSTISGPLRPSSYFILYSDLVTANINGDNGAISVPSSTALGTYTLYIYYLGSYNVVTINLTVTEAPTPTPTPSPTTSFPVQRISLNQKSSFCGTRAVSATAVGIGSIRGKGSATRIFNNCKNNNSSDFQICQFRVLGFK